MAEGDSFFEQRRLTSKLKHCVLEAYMEKLARHPQDVLYYVDGFAGEGEYGVHTGAPEAGSPVRIADLAQRLLAERPNFRLRCINVEEDDERFARLEAATARFPSSIIAANLHGAFVEALPDIFERIGDAPSFFFIDPWGTKDIPFQALLPVFKRPQWTEVLITFHTAGIIKKVGFFAHLDDPSSTPGEIEYARAVTENIARALNISWDELRTWWRESQSAHTPSAFLELRLLTHYRTTLRRATTTFKFTKVFPVYYPDPDVPPGSGDRVCFFLVFGAQREPGLLVMNNAMVAGVRRFVSEVYSHTLFPSLAPEMDHQHALAELDEAVIRYFRASASFTVDHVKRTLMQETMLLVTEGDYVNGVRRLKKMGRLEQLDPGPPKNATTRYRVIS